MGRAAGGHPGARRLTSLHERVGGDAYFVALVERFYARVEDDPVLRPIYPANLEPGKANLAAFLAQYWGGPPSYSARRGHPRLRMRHFPFAIGSRERDEWLWCMDRAMDEQPMPAELHVMLKEKLHALADHMRNRPDSA